MQKTPWPKLAQGAAAPASGCRYKKKSTAEPALIPRALAIGKTRELPLISNLTRIATDRQVARGVNFLAASEPRFAEIAKQNGVPSARRTENNLASLLQIVTEQLISLKASQAIWNRITAVIHPLSAEKILGLELQDLHNLGLNASKAKCFRAAAHAVASGKLDFDHLETLSDAEVLAALVSLPGVGPWTADIFLLSALGRSDAFPAGDLALQVAAQNLFELVHRPSARELVAMAEAWRPWRSVAARLLWSHYRVLKGMGQA